MSTLSEEWIEIDDQHVQHRQIATYTKAELATIFGIYGNPFPKVDSQAISSNQNTSIENNQANELENKNGKE